MDDGEEGKIDHLCEAAMKWAMTGKICEDVYFRIRHRVFHILAVLCHRWFPTIRQAEKQLKACERYLRPRHSWIEQLGRGFWGLLCVFLLPLVIVLALVFIAAFRLPMLVANTGDPSALTGILRTIGAMLAALTGILLAVIGLAIKSALEDFPGMRFLLGAFARRQGFAPIAALLFGTLITIAAGVVWGERLSLQQLNDWVFLSASAALVSTFLLFDLFRRSLQGLGDTDIDDLLEAELCNRWRDHTRSAFRQIFVEINLRRKLAALGFVRHPCTERASPGQIECHLRRYGIITAIDFAPLRRVAKLLSLRKIEPNLDLSYDGWLTDHATNSTCLTTPEHGQISPKKSLALLIVSSSSSLPADIGSRIGGLVQRAFILRRVRSTPGSSAIPRLLSVLTGAIEKRDASFVETATVTFETIFEEYLSVFPDFVDSLKEVGAKPPGGFMMLHAYKYSEPHPPQLDLFKLAIRAMQNDSLDCVREIFKSVYKLSRICFEKDNPKLFGDCISELYRTYCSAGVSSGSQGTSGISGEVARWLSSISQYLLGPYLFRREGSLPHIERLEPFVIHYYWLCLHLLKRSIEECDKTMSDRVLKDLANFLKHRLPSDVKWILEQRASDGTYPGLPNGVGRCDAATQEKFMTLCNDFYDYKNLVYLVGGAWLMYQVKCAKLDAEFATPFMTKLVDSIPDFRNLLDLYPMASAGAGHVEDLGFLHWHVPYSPYSHATAGTAFQIWICPFYEFLLLKKASRSSARVHLDNIRQTPMADHESLRDLLKALADPGYALPDEYQDVPWGIDAKDLKTAKEQIKEVLSSWAKSDDSTSPQE